MAKIEKPKLLFIHDNSEILNNLSELIKPSFQIKKLKKKIENLNDLLEILIKKEAYIFFQFDKEKNILKIGRRYNSEIINCITYEVKNFKSIKKVKEENKNSEIEVGFNYFTVFKNMNEIETNLWTHLFSKNLERVDLNSIGYYFEIVKNGDEYDFKFCKILDESKFEEIGPIFTLKKLDEFFSDKNFDKATRLDEEEEEKDKNIYSDDFKNVKGKVHVESFDLKGLRLKKKLFKK